MPTPSSSSRTPRRPLRGLAPALVVSLLAHAALGLWLGPDLRALGPAAEAETAPVHRVSLSRPSAAPAKPARAEPDAEDPARAESPSGSQPAKPAASAESPPEEPPTLRASAAKRPAPPASQPTEPPAEPQPDKAAESTSAPEPAEKPEGSKESDQTSSEESADQPAEANPSPAPASQASAGSPGDRPARPMSGGGNPRPRYPLTARRMGLEGRVVLAVTVAPDGSARSVSVAKSSGHTVLDRAARRTVRRWRFRPARAGGRASEATIRVPIRFQLR